MFSIKIIEELGTEAKWYDLIKCEYDTKTITLPAAFFKSKVVLSNDIELGDENHYRLDFTTFKKNGRTIDELFADYIKKQKKPVYREMLKFCRHLYRQPSGEKNSYDKPVDQAERQFRKEFQGFLEHLNFKKYICNMEYNEKNLYFIRDLLKIFILFRTSKIKDIEYPLDINREYLPDEAKIIELENILALDKDNYSVAALNGYSGSQNEIYIKKLYALLWTNLEMNVDEIEVVLGYIVCLEQISFELIYKDFYTSISDALNTWRYIPAEKLEPNNGKKKIKYVKNLIEEETKKKIWGQMIMVMEAKRDILIEYFISKGIKISVFAYYILKIYINNRMKIINWRVLVEKKLKDADDIFVTEAHLIKINGITKSMRIEKADDFINSFNRDKSLLTNEQQNTILDFIFPNNKRSKEQKREILKRNNDKIIIIYAMYVLRRGLAGMKVKYNHFYNMVIASYLFFNRCDIKLDNMKYKNFNDGHKMDARRKKIDNLLYQIKNNKIDEASLGEGTDFVYLEIIDLMLSRYYNWFELKPEPNMNLLNEFMGMYDLLYELWEIALKTAYNMATVDKNGIS